MLTLATPKSAQAPPQTCSRWRGTHLAAGGPTTHSCCQALGWWLSSQRPSLTQPLPVKPVHGEPCLVLSSQAQAPRLTRQPMPCGLFQGHFCSHSYRQHKPPSSLPPPQLPVPLDPQLSLSRCGSLEWTSLDVGTWQPQAELQHPSVVRLLSLEVLGPLADGGLQA